MEAIDQSCADAALVDSLTLSLIPGIGPRILTALLNRFGNARDVLSASPSDLASVFGVGPKLIAAIADAKHLVDAKAIIRWCDDHKTCILVRGTDAYPRLLEQLPDAPPVLFSRGQYDEEDEVAVAIVGTRHATRYGRKQAARFAYGLASAGVTVVSGLARGIDAAAHQAALEAGGRTIAILGSGIGQIYPREHISLADSIADQGAVMTEFAPLAKPRSGMFPQRNRLISGMSLATLVIEAPDRSGALITARLAMEQNRDVLALPGPVNSHASRGCHQLIRDGATLVQSVDEILEQLGPLGQTVHTRDGRCIRNGAELALNEIERQVLCAIDTTSTAIDQVIANSGQPASRVIAVISVLETRHLVRRLSAQYVARV